MVDHRKTTFKVEKFIHVADDSLLRKFFEQRKVSIPSKFKFAKGDALHDFWFGIGEINRKSMEAELHLIDGIAENARDYVQEVLQDCNIATEKNESGETATLRIFLHDDKDAFQQVYDKYSCMAYLHSVSTYKFKSGEADVSDNALETFKEQIKELFGGDGKSRHCKIRKYDDDEKFFMLVARGDYIKTGREFDDSGEIVISSSRPVEEDFVFFHKQTKVFKLKIGGQGRKDKAKEKYLKSFGKKIMGVKEINDEVVDRNVVDLDPIKKKEFSYAGNEHIEMIKLTHVNEKYSGLRVVISGGNIEPFFDSFKLGSAKTEINGVKLKFWIKQKDKKSKAYIVEIKAPETVAITEEGEVKKIIEDYLHEQGVLRY